MSRFRIPLIVWFLVPSLIIVGAGVWFLTKNPTIAEPQDSDKPVAVSNPVEGTQELEVVGREHISQGTEGSGYNSNPPTSGPHWSSPAKNGFYESPFPDMQLIHNLEHGYVWIAYKGDVGDEVKNKIKEIVEKDNWKVIAAPRDENETKIALVAWGRLLKMDEPDFERIENFIKTYRNRGPESTPE